MPEKDKLPKVLLFDEKKVDAVLRSAAVGMAISMNSETVWKKDNSASAAVLSFLEAYNPFAAIPRRITQGHWGSEGPGSQEFVIHDARVATAQAQNLMMFRANFARESAKGPQQAAAYLQTRMRDANTAWGDVRFKSKATQMVNSEVLAILDSSIRRAEIVKTTCDATMAVGLCFVPGSWIAVTAAGAGYHLACELVKGASGVGKADIIAYVRDSVANASQHGVVTGVTRAGVGISTNWERESVRRAQILADKVAQYARQGGSNLSAAQRRRLVKHSAKAAAAAKDAAKASRIKLGVGGAFAAINLYYMKDDLAKALGHLWKELSPKEQSEWEAQFKKTRSS
jgi:hypothetical protein